MLERKSKASKERVACAGHAGFSPPSFDRDARYHWSTATRSKFDPHDRQVLFGFLLQLLCC
jgi:hypothetical protein